jgi:hypothetical protein
VFKGSTVKYLLKNCPEIKKYYAIDPFVPYKKGAGRLSRLDEATWEKMYDKVSKLKKYFNSLEIMRMTSSEAAKILKNRNIKIGLTFIDGSHFYNDVSEDIKSWLPLTKKIICGHDYEAGNHPGVAKAVNEFFDKSNIIKLKANIWAIKIGSLNQKIGQVI